MTGDEKPKEIIDGVPDFGKLRDSSEQSGESIPSADQDPHGIGGKARAMHDAQVDQQAKLPIALMRGGGALLQGSEAIAYLPDKLNMLGQEQEQIEISLGKIRIGLEQRPHDYLKRETEEEEDLMNGPQVAIKPKTQGFSLFILGREIVISFDPIRTDKTELSDRQASKLLGELDGLWTYLSSDQERAILGDAKRLIEEITPRSQQEARDFRKRAHAEADQRSVSISIGRGTNPENPEEFGITLTHELEGNLATNSLHLTELIRGAPGQPATARDITDEGLFIPTTDQNIFTVSAGTHAIIELDARNTVKVKDGKNGYPSTNGTAVARKMITELA